MKVLKIGALWCPACLIVNKHLKKITDLEVISYDYDMDEEVVEKYNIGTTLPVLIFLNKNDLEVKRLIGEVSQKEIEDVLNEMD